MKATSFFLYSALLAVFLLAGWAFLGPITFERGSTITIEGSSNVHGWSCDVKNFSANASGQAGGSVLTSLTALRVNVPVTGIDCDNGTMNGKLRDALGSSPISYTLTSATLGSARGNQFPIQVSGRLSIHGQTKSVSINAQAQSLGGNRFKVTGSVPVVMSQYGVSPPTAMMGTMRTRDNVTVKFDVTMNAGS